MSDRQIPGLRARLTLDTSDVGRGLADATRQVRGFAAYGINGLTGVRVAAAGIGVGLGAAVKGIVGAGIAFQDSLNSFRAVTTATGDQMKAVSKLAVDLGNDLSLPNTSAADAANAMTSLAKAGLTVQDSMLAAKGALQLATAAQEDAGTAAEQVANALNQFQLDGSAATSVADLFAGAANAASGNASDFALGLQQVGAVAHGAHLSLQDTVAGLALFAKNGQLGQDAGTSFKQMILSLQAPMQRGAKALHQFGIEVYDSTGASLPFKTVVGEMHDKLGSLSDQARNQALYKIFGSDAIKVAEILTAQGVPALQSMEDQVTKAGQAAQVAAAKSQGLGGAVRGLTNEIQTLSLEGFLKVAPGLEQFTRRFTNDIPGALHAAGTALGLLRNALAPLGPTVLSLVDAGEHLVHALEPAGAVLGTVVGAATLATLHAGALALEGIATAIDGIAKHEALIVGVGAAIATAFAASKLAAAAAGVRALMAALEGRAALTFVNAAGAVGVGLRGLASGAGIAAVGIGAVAYGLFHSREEAAKVRAEIKKLADQLVGSFDTRTVGSVADYAAMIRGLRDDIANSVPQIQGLTDATGRITAQALSAANVMKIFGGNVGDAGKHILAAKQAGDDLNAKLAQVTTTVAALGVKYKLNGDAVLDLAQRNKIDLTGSVDTVVGAFAGLQTKASGATQSQKTLATATNETAAGFDGAAQAAKGFNDALDQLIGIPLDAAKAQLQLKVAITQATAALQQNGRTLDENTPKGQANKDALFGIATQALAAAKALETTDKNSVRAGQAIAQGRQQFIASAVAMGDTKAQAKALADQLGLIPAQVAKLVPALKDAAKGTKDSGKSVGIDFTQGLAQGIYQTRGQAEAAARDVAALAKAAAKIELRAQSPSKAMIEVGQDFGDGFVIGIQGSAARAVTAAASLAAQALAAARQRVVGGNIGSAQTALAQAVSARGDAAGVASRAAGIVPGAQADFNQAFGAQVKAANNLATITTRTNAATAAAEKHAKALDAAAQAARRHAQDVNASTTATKAEKAAAEAAARQAERDAQDANDDAAAIKKRGDAQVAAAKKNADAAQQALDTARQAYTDATDANAQAQQQLADANKAVADAQAALADAVYAAQQKQAEGFVGHVKDALDKVLASVTSFRSSFAQGLTSGADLGSIFRAQGQDAVSSVDDVIAELQARITAGTQFKADLDKLGAAGATPAVLAQIAGEGSNFGEQELQAIFAGGSGAIASLNDLTGQLTNLATTGVDQLASNEFGPAADQLVASLGGLTDQFPELAASIGDLTAAVESAFGSATAGPDVAAIAAQVAAGLGTTAPDLSIHVDLSGSSIDQTTLAQLEALLAEQQAELNQLLQQGVGP